MAFRWPWERERRSAAGYPSPFVVGAPGRVQRFVAGDDARWVGTPATLVFPTGESADAAANTDKTFDQEGSYRVASVGVDIERSVEAWVYLDGALLLYSPGNELGELSYPIDRRPEAQRRIRVRIKNGTEDVRRARVIIIATT